jgi:hypothetical protein
MRRATMLPAAALALLATACVSERTEAQSSLAQRVRAAGDGMVELHFAARPGVCGDGRRYFSMGRRSYFGEFTSGRDSRSCEPGPTRVRMRVERGTISDLKATGGPQLAHEERATDLGEVGSAEAARYLLAVADTSRSGVARGAITAAVLADSVSVWPQLLALATDTTHASRSTRHDAMSWVGRFAAAKVSGHGEDIAAYEDDAGDRDDRDDARDAAVFALSQLRGKEGVEPLLQVARSHKDPQLRQKAIFWLGESGDPRAVALFREILKG